MNRSLYFWNKKTLQSKLYINYIQLFIQINKHINNINNLSKQLNFRIKLSAGLVWRIRRQPTSMCLSTLVSVRTANGHLPLHSSECKEMPLSFFLDFEAGYKFFVIIIIRIFSLNT